MTPRGDFELRTSPPGCPIELRGGPGHGMQLYVLREPPDQIALPGRPPAVYMLTGWWGERAQYKWVEATR